MIMVSGHKDTASAPAQKELAEEVLGKLASGAEFEQIAQVYSEDSTKDNGGDWGWIERKTLAEPLQTSERRPDVVWHLPRTTCTTYRGTERRILSPEVFVLPPKRRLPRTHEGSRDTG
jgi:hypothetical protein